MAYPTTLDTGGTLPSPNTSDKTNSPSHAGLHGLENAAIIATETKLGTGASTPASNTLLIGTGAGTSSWSALTSSQLAAVLSDETGTGSAVFGTTPTLVTPKVDTINEATGGNGTTIGGVNLKSGVITTSGAVGTAAILASAVVTAAKMKYGMVRQRQGATIGDNPWNTAGTSNTDTSAKDVFMQLGVVNVTSTDMLVTFPVPFTQPPHIQATTSSASTNNAFAIANNVTTTGFTLRTINDAGGGISTERVNWLAIGQ